VKTLLILSGIPFKFMKQRPQHIAEYFSSKGYRVLYLGLDEKYEILPRKKIEELSLSDILNHYTTDIIGNIYILKNIFTTKNRSINELKTLVSKICDCIDDTDITVLAALPYWLDCVSNISANIKLIYDCLDDWEGFVKDLDIGMDVTVIQKERKLASIADLVLASANRLYAKMSLYNKNVYYLPNGVWNKDYSIDVKKQFKPNDISEIKEPIIFFMGGIAGWVDTKLIHFLAKERPEYSFVFVGEKIKAKLPQENNIYFLGKKHYSELPLYLNQAKVAIIPFKETNLTASVTPLKYYEYMSAGIPVVSTMLPDLVHLKGSKVVQNYEEFLRAIDYYVNLSEEDYNKASSLARITSKLFDWNRLLEPLCNFLEENKNFKVPSKGDYICKTVNNYKEFRKNNVIKNELISLYNILGDFEKTTSLFPYEELIEEKLPLDYNQLALAFYMIGEKEKSLKLLKIFLRMNKDLILHSNYINTLIDSEDMVYHAFLLKMCGRQYEALHIIDSTNINTKLAGLLSGMYFDIAEYQIAIDYAVYVLENLEQKSIDEVLDPYCISDIIDYLITTGEYKIAEELSLELMGKGMELEEVAVKKLGEIYFITNIPKDED
jgi:hypothetical protein